jgi:predicted RNase H-like HicB family nuclease
MPKSLVRENRTQGTVRGRSGNWPSYLDCLETLERMILMETKKFMYYQDDDMLIGWLDDFPDYKTQGSTLDELKENLKDIYDELTSGRIPSVIHVGELRVA